MKEAVRKVVIKFGVPLVLASSGLATFLHDWEADKKQATKVYADRLARGIPTVCDGITPATSPYPVIVGDVWSQERCDEVNRMVVEKTQLKLLDCVKTRISQYTFDALSSHAHNVGVGNTCASKALGLINAGRLAEGYHLNPAETSRLAKIHGEWSASRARRDWRRADRLRGYMERAGCMGPNMELWHPVFEEPAHRRRRLRDRESTGARQ